MVGSQDTDVMVNNIVPIPATLYKTFQLENIWWLGCSIIRSSKNPNIVINKFKISFHWSWGGKQLKNLMANRFFLRLYRRFMFPWETWIFSTASKNKVLSFPWKDLVSTIWKTSTKTLQIVNRPKIIKITPLGFLFPRIHIFF